MSALPRGWATAPIGDLCSLKNGRAFKPSDWVDSGVPIVRIQNLNNSEAPYNFFSGEFEQRYHLKGGELLFAWSGTPGTSFGAHVWRGGEAVLNQHIFRVDFDESYIDKRFFRFAINQKLDDLIGIAHGGVGLRHVTKGKFESTEISLPPLAEQRRIADRLDALLACVDATRARLDRIPFLLKRFRQSVLAAATSGQLTEDWRQEQSLKASVKAIAPVHHRSEKKQPSLEERVEKANVSVESDTTSRASQGFLGEWRRVALAQVAHDFSYGSAAKSSKIGRVPVLRMGNIQDGKLDWGDLVFSSDESEIRKYSLVAGDVLFNRTNSPALVGKTAVFNGEREAIYAGYLIRVRCASQLLPNYLNYCLGSPAGRDYCWQVKSDGVSQSNINAKKLAAFEFDLPSVTEQSEIVRRVEALFALADAVESRYSLARAQIDKLPSALLAKAFRGELVPQDPSDEPAETLLERIRFAGEVIPAASSKVRKPRQRREAV